MDQKTIFVQIASYRDPELEKTVEDMIKNAKRPKNLRIGICRQYHPDDKFDTLDKWRDVESVQANGMLIENKAHS